MLLLSKKKLIFAPSFVNNIRRHRGERLSFDPYENLKIRSMRAKSLKAASPAVAFIQRAPMWSQLTYIPAGVS